MAGTVLVENHTQSIAIHWLRFAIDPRDLRQSSTYQSMSVNIYNMRIIYRYICIYIIIVNWKFIGHVELIDSLFLAPSRRCLARTGRSSPLVVALREQIGDRLLIAGAHTRRLRCWGNIFVFCLLYFATKVQSRRFMPCIQARATFTIFADLCGVSVSCEVIEVCWYRGSGGDSVLNLIEVMS